MKLPQHLGQAVARAPPVPDNVRFIFVVGTLAIPLGRGGRSCVWLGRRPLNMSVCSAERAKEPNQYAVERTPSAGSGDQTQENFLLLSSNGREWVPPTSLLHAAEREGLSRQAVGYIFGTGST